MSLVIPDSTLLFWDCLSCRQHTTSTEVSLGCRSMTQATATLLTEQTLLPRREWGERGWCWCWSNEHWQLELLLTVAQDIAAQGKQNCDILCSNCCKCFQLTIMYCGIPNSAWWIQRIHPLYHYYTYTHTHTHTHTYTHTHTHTHTHAHTHTHTAHTHTHSTQHTHTHNTHTYTYMHTHSTYLL